MKRIKAAAIKNKETGVVWSLPVPARHHDLIQVCTDWDKRIFEQGFITEDYHYVDRTEAKKIAVEANQLVTDIRLTSHHLFSEDVWEGRYEHIHDFCGWELFHEYKEDNNNRN